MGVMEGDSKRRSQSIGRVRRRSFGRWFRVAWAAAACAAVCSAFAQEGGVAQRVRTVDNAVEGYVSDIALQVQYVRDVSVEGLGPVEGRVGAFYNEQRDLIGVGDLLAYLGDQADRRLIDVSVGTRVYAAFLNEENEDTLGVGFGGEAEWFFSRDRRTSLKASAFYAPDILTFGIADNVTDWGVRLMTRIRENTDIFVGYRALEFETRVGDREVDDHLHVGFRRVF
jgi:hypothetical protein